MHAVCDCHTYEDTTYFNVLNGKCKLKTIMPHLKTLAGLLVDTVHIKTTYFTTRMKDDCRKKKHLCYSLSLNFDICKQSSTA